MRRRELRTGADGEQAMCLHFVREVSERFGRLAALKVAASMVPLLRLSVDTAAGAWAKGFEAGCTHTWLATGHTGPYPDADNRLLMRGLQGTAEDVLTRMRQVEDEITSANRKTLEEIRTVWEAFRRASVRRGVDPSVLLSRYSPPTLEQLTSLKVELEGVTVQSEALAVVMQALLRMGDRSAHQLEVATPWR